MRTASTKTPRGSRRTTKRNTRSRWSTIRATSTSRRAPSILAVGAFNTGKSYRLGELQGEMGHDPSDHEFDAYRYHMALTRYVQCVTCFVRGDAYVNICDMPGRLLDTRFENEFRQHFMAAVNLVIEHAGPITKSSTSTRSAATTSVVTTCVHGVSIHGSRRLQCSGS